MTVLSIILGIIMICGGFSCMFAPITTYISAQYLFVIMVAVFGIIGVIKGIIAKRFEVTFYFSIVSILFGLAACFFPQFFVISSVIYVYMLACWIILLGVTSIYNSIAVGKATGSSMWILQLILGILVILFGCYAFVHPVLFAASIAGTLGFLMGLGFVVTGFTMVFAPLTKDE